jgi:small subunit ribosomal protein S1
MLKNRQLVFDKSEEMAEKYRQKMMAEAEGKAADEAIEIPPALDSEEEIMVSAIEE